LAGTASAVGPLSQKVVILGLLYHDDPDDALAAEVQPSLLRGCLCHVVLAPTVIVERDAFRIII